MAGASFAGWEPPPDAFAVVMATGIVAVAGYDHGYWRLGIALSVLAVVAFGALILGVPRLVATRLPRLIALARDPDVMLRTFTFVAACAVLGVRFTDHLAVVTLLCGLALAAWLVLAPLALVAASRGPARSYVSMPAARGCCLAWRPRVWRSTRRTSPSESAPPHWSSSPP